jgi:hypothetical protein
VPPMKAHSHRQLHPARSMSANSCRHPRRVLTWKCNGANVPGSEKMAALLLLPMKARSHRQLRPAQSVSASSHRQLRGVLARKACSHRQLRPAQSMSASSLRQLREVLARKYKGVGLDLAGEEKMGVLLPIPLQASARKLTAR